jgi:hypothetical protein
MSGALWRATRADARGRETQSFFPPARFIATYVAMRRRVARSQAFVLPFSDMMGLARVCPRCRVFPLSGMRSRVDFHENISNFPTRKGVHGMAKSLYAACLAAIFCFGRVFGR